MQESNPPTEEGFDPSWLNERFAYDSAARNQQVEAAFLRQLQSTSIAPLCDVGSGTASNLIYFLPRIEQSQRWWLVEQDPVLQHFAFDRIGAFAKSAGYTFVKYTYPVIHLRKAQQDVYVELVEGSLMELNALVPLDEIAVVTAGAVFDLFSEAQFQTFGNMLLDHSCSLLATLNYTDMEIGTSDTATQGYIALYEAHMQRPQDFGIGMGKECPRVMQAFYESSKAVDLTFGESHWQLDSEAKAMHQFLLGFMKESVASMIEDPAALPAFYKWIEQQQATSQQGKLSMRVGHVDLFAEFAG